MHAHRDEGRHRRDAADQIARPVLRLEREDRLDFGVARKGFRAWHENRAAVAIDRVAPLLRGAKSIGDAVLIADEKVGAIDDYTVRVARLDLERPQHGR